MGQEQDRRRRRRKGANTVEVYAPRIVDMLRTARLIGGDRHSAIVTACGCIMTLDALLVAAANVIEGKLE